MLCGVFIGMTLPALAAAVRPLVVPISVAMVVVSMLRVDPSRLAATFRRPVFVVLAAMFVLIVLPALTYGITVLLGGSWWLATGLTFASAAPPLSSAAAFAILVRIDPALVTGVSLPAIMIAPGTVWLVTAALPGLGEGVELGGLVLRLLGIIGGSLIAALLVRRVVGESRVNNWASWLDFTTVALIVLIAVGVMHDIGIAFRTDALAWLGILALTALLSLVSLLVTIAVFWPAGRDRAFAAALCASIKNMAVMVAAVSGTVDPRISLVVITAQFPIFLSPLIMRPLFRRLGHAGAP